MLKDWISRNGPRIALIPNSRDMFSDGERKEKGVTSDVSSLEALGFKVTVISLKDYFGNTERLRDDIKKFNAFFAIGGNAFVLRQAMKQSGFDDYLKEISCFDNYLYAGYSAGICILAPDMHGLELADDPTANPYNCEAIYEGLGLIDYLPIPHYKSDHPESKAMGLVAEYLDTRNIKYITLHDGDVIIEDTLENKQ